MFFTSFRKNTPDASSDVRSQFLALSKLHAPTSSQFLNGFQAVLRLLDLESLSFFQFESKTRLFLLRHWAGEKPARLSLPVGNEFFEYVRMQSGPIRRSAFVKGGREVRDSALFFFQQTASETLWPILNGQEWLGFVACKAARSKETSEYEDLIQQWVLNIESWMAFQTVEEQARQLRELGQIKTQLMSNVSHELKTPLNGIVGTTEALRDQWQGMSDQEREHTFSLLLRATHDLAGTVENILKLTEIESKKDRVHFQRVNAWMLVREVADLFRHVLDQKGVALCLPTQDEGADVFVEPDLIRTVLMNLLSNAVKFTDKGWIRVAFHKSGEKLHVVVSDSGIGVSDEKQAVIFEEFVQGDGSHTRSAGGTGLGLAIAKKIVALHEGRIWVESQVGAGSQFTFTLPVFPGR